MNTGKMTLIAVVIFFSSLAYQADAQEVCTEGNPVLRPQFVVGDMWFYNSVPNHLSTTVNHSKIEFEKYDQELIVHRRTLNGVSSHSYTSPDGNLVKSVDARGKNTSFDEKPLLRFPLFKGKSWSGTFQFESSNSQGEYTGVRTRKIKVVVVGPEIITIAGEVMPACRLQAESYIVGQSNPFEQRETYWYSPRAKKIVKYESVTEGRGSRSYEMKSYTLGRGGEVAEK